MLNERVITIEYLVPSMSETLLHKFPDNSSYGFNYSESSIWSPLLPHSHPTSSNTFVSAHKSLKTSTKSMKRTTKRKGGGGGKRLDFSPMPCCYNRGWNRLLKAAKRKFKVQKRNAMQMLLPTL